ncbi:GyrI-like domain-containing protein [Flavobacteriaceae bacterium M23B6Z8]
MTNKARKLWSTFMPRKNEIENPLNSSFLSIQVYPEGFDITDFTPETEFTTRAGIEIKKVSAIPEGMELFIIPEGTYAVFEHRGSTKEFHKTASFIFEEWLPASDYDLDDRPHFELLDDRYLGPDHSDSIEDIYIPIIDKK